MSGLRSGEVISRYRWKRTKSLISLRHARDSPNSPAASQAKSDSFGRLNITFNVVRINERIYLTNRSKRFEMSTYLDDLVDERSLFPTYHAKRIAVVLFTCNYFSVRIRIRARV